MTDIDSIIKSITKDIDFGGKLQSLADASNPEVIPFGLPTLDAIVGGGIPRGRVSEISGNPSCGKSSLCLRLIAEAQKRSINCCYIDAELAMTQDLAQKMGVDIHSVLYAQPSTGEEAFELIEDASEKGYGLIVVDSVSSLEPAAELDGDYMDQTIGLQARMMSKAFRKIIGCINRNNTALVFVNQVREKMAKMPGAKTTTTSGGRALGFYAAIRLEVVRTGWETDSDKNRVGMSVKIHVEKNKIGEPQKSTEVVFLFESGFDVLTDKLNKMIADKQIERIGNTYYKDGEKIGGKKETQEWLKTT